MSRMCSVDSDVDVRGLATRRVLNAEDPVDLAGVRAACGADAALDLDRERVELLAVLGDVARERARLVGEADQPLRIAGLLQLAERLLGGVPEVAQPLAVRLKRTGKLVLRVAQQAD
jgi:hypothetical protein